MLTVGVDLGGTKCLGVVVDADGHVVDEHRVPTPSGVDAVVDAVVSCAATLVEGCRDAGRAGGVAGVGGVEGVAGVGVGLPGLVDAGGTLRYAPNLPGVTEVPVGSLLRARFPGVPVVVENDASCAGWGEREAGAGRSSDHVVMITLGTGIGGGIVLGGRLYRGAHGFAGEVGHMVVDPDGPPCPCGQRGCWERFASGSGLARLARAASAASPVGAAGASGAAGAPAGASRMVELAGGDPESVRGEHVTQAAAEGDATALDVLASYAWWVALGLANLANAFDPELFVLGGGMVEAGDLLLDPVRSAFATLVEAVEHRPPVDIVPAALGEHAGAIGAALLARPR